jgi:hypothetical protein
MMELVRVVQDFIRESIQLYPKKCEMLKIGKDPHETFPVTDESTGETALLDCINNKEVIRYLGPPLRKNKISKMKWFQPQLTKMKNKAIILTESGLKTTQVIDSIQTFILPMSEFLLRHSNLSLTKLKSFDVYLRKLINKNKRRLTTNKRNILFMCKMWWFCLILLL